jgi:hypothetical protein
VVFETIFEQLIQVLKIATTERLRIRQRVANEITPESKTVLEHLDMYFSRSYAALTFIGINMEPNVHFNALLPKYKYMDMESA